MECPRDQKSSRDIRKLFESNIIQGPSEDAGDQMSFKYHRDQRSFKDLWKIVTGRDHTRIVGKIIQEPSKVFIIKDRSKIIEFKGLAKTVGRSSR